MEITMQMKMAMDIPVHISYTTTQTDCHDRTSGGGSTPPKLHVMAFLQFRLKLTMLQPSGNSIIDSIGVHYWKPPCLDP